MNAYKITFKDGVELEVYNARNLGAAKATAVDYRLRREAQPQVKGANRKPLPAIKRVEKISSELLTTEGHI